MREEKMLHNENQIPVAIDNQVKEWDFGCKAEQIVQALENEFISPIKAEEIAMLGMKIETDYIADDFKTHTITIKFARKNTSKAG